MKDESPEDVANRIAAALVDDKAIDYGSGFKDREFPEITWAMYGIPETNEIVVTATVGTLCLGIADQSNLLYPAMIDRIFGIDISDAVLVEQLTERLWTVQSSRLVAEAIRIRRME
jgi:hypothetical protein